MERTDQRKFTGKIYQANLEEKELNIVGTATMRREIGRAMGCFADILYLEL